MSICRPKLIPTAVEGKDYLVTLVKKLRSTTIINCCKTMFARYGIPQDPSSKEFADFAKKYNFSHVTHFPAQAESAVKIVKRLLKDADDPHPMGRKIELSTKDSQ